MAQPLDLELSADPSHAKRLRNELQRWLGNAGINGHVRHDITVAVTEAFNNAVEHPRERATSRVMVSGELDDDEVVIHVRDDGRWQPHSDPGRRHYGRQLMGALMSRIDVHRAPGHTTVTLRRSVERVHPPQPD